jgi:hypothetical protein
LLAQGAEPEVMGSFHDMPKLSSRLWPPPPIDRNHEVLMWPVSDKNLKPNLRPEIAQARKKILGGPEAKKAIVNPPLETSLKKTACVESS